MELKTRLVSKCFLSTWRQTSDGCLYMVATDQRIARLNSANKPFLFDMLDTVIGVAMIREVLPNSILHVSKWFVRVGVGN